MVENGFFSWSDQATEADIEKTQIAIDMTATPHVSARQEPVDGESKTNEAEAPGAEENGDDHCLVQLRDINFSAGKGRLTAVVGSVGSGKSSLLSCLLGEMFAVRGGAHIIAEKIGFVAQKVCVVGARGLGRRDE